MKDFRKIILTSCILLIAFSVTAHAVRIKEIAQINGVRTNQLIGYGLVVGLKMTGDKANTLFTNQSLANMLDKMGVAVDPRATKVQNVAAVMVTATLPPFSVPGNRIDAVVSSIGDAQSLEGGMLLLTPLKGGDGQVYGVAQGPLVVGGFAAGGQGAKVQRNHPTVGRVPNGVLIEQEVNYTQMKLDPVLIALKVPDFTTSTRIAERINQSFGPCAAAKDGGNIAVSIPEGQRGDPVRFLSLLENLEVRPDVLAKIVVDEKTGTVVIGENVKIGTVAVSHGNISVQVKEEPKVSQPMPFSGGQTIVTPETQVRVEEEKGHFVVMEGGVTIKELVAALNAVGLSTRDVIMILQTIKAAGVLHAELEVI